MEFGLNSANRGIMENSGFANGNLQENVGQTDEDSVQDGIESNDGTLSEHSSKQMNEAMKDE